MNQTTLEILRLLGYPLGSILSLVILAYLGRQFFEKLLESVVSRDLEALKKQNSEALEALKKDYQLVLEERKADLAKALEEKKAELSKETERLKTALSVEAETYRLAAQKRFEYLLALWESSESLLKDTDFSDINSIRISLERIDKNLSNLSKYSVLFSPSTTTHIHLYLKGLATVLTNSEKNFKEKTIEIDKISLFLDVLSGPLGLISPTLGLVAGLSTNIVPSIGKHLEKYRYNAVLKARQNLEMVVRTEFGILISDKTLPISSS